MSEVISSGVLLRAVLAAGLFSGLMLASFNLTVSDRLVDRAVQWEEQYSTDTGGHGDVFTRREQKVGLVVGELFFGLMTMAVFAGVFALGYEALPGASAWAKGMVLAAMAFVAAFLVPFARYPARPPGVGEPDTVYQRQGLYLGLLALSVAGMIVAVRAWRAWADRPLRRTALVAGYALWVAALLVFFPDNPDPIVDFPNRLLWQFRVASVAGQFIFWTSLGLTFGAFIERFTAAERETALGRVE